MSSVLDVVVKLLELDGVSDLFKPEQAVEPELRYHCKTTLSEELVVDTLAYYDSVRKRIVVCKDLLERAIRMHRIDKAECYDAFVLYVLLHEHVHYVTDVVGLLKHFSNLSTPARFDEPFCEYIALKAIATGLYRVFGSEKSLKTPFNAKMCTPLISSLHRPLPYNLFRELYAIPSEVFGRKPEEILLELLYRPQGLIKTLKKLSLIEPEAVFSLRLALLGKLSGQAKGRTPLSLYRYLISKHKTFERDHQVRVVVI